MSCLSFASPLLVLLFDIVLKLLNYQQYCDIVQCPTFLNSLDESPSYSYCRSALSQFLIQNLPLSQCLEIISKACDVTVSTFVNSKPSSFASFDIEYACLLENCALGVNNTLIPFCKCVIMLNALARANNKTCLASDMHLTNFAISGVFDVVKACVMKNKYCNIHTNINYDAKNLCQLYDNLVTLQCDIIVEFMSMSSELDFCTSAVDVSLSISLLETSTEILR